MNYWSSLLSNPIDAASLFIATVALLYSVIKLNQRLSKAKLSYRLFFSILHLLLFASIISLIVRPEYSSTQPLAVKLIVYDSAHSLQPLKSDEYLYLKSLQAIDQQYYSRFRDQIILYPEQLLIKYPTLSTLHIIGDGLTQDQLTLFRAQTIVHHPAQLLTGVIEPSWQSTINIGESLIFSGQLQAMDDAIYTAELVNPGQQLVDKISLRHAEYFQLQAQPKLVGQHSYQLRLLDNKGVIISQQTLPVQVEESLLAKILVVQSSPSFEIKQMQNWAGEYGAQIVINTRISKNKTITRATNSKHRKNESIRRQPFDSKLLATFDLLILDGRELLSLSFAQQDNLKTAINNGLGVLVLIDEALVSAQPNERPAIISPFAISPITSEVRVDALPVDAGKRATVLADNLQLSAAPLFTFGEEKTQLEALLATSQNQVLVAKLNMGLGAVTLSSLKEVYQLRTSNQHNAYSKIWSYLIAKTARKQRSNFISVNSSNPLIWQDQRTEICRTKQTKSSLLTTVSDVENPIIITSGEVKSNSLSHNADAPGHKIIMQPHATLAHRECGFFWPKNTGWHKAIFDNNQTLQTSYFFVHAANSWLEQQQHQRIKATQTRGNPLVVRHNPQTHSNIINDWIFWAMIWLTSGIIWIERKFWSK